MVTVAVTGIMHDEIPGDLREVICGTINFKKNYDFGGKIVKYLFCHIIFSSMIYGIQNHFITYFKPY